MNEKIIYTGLLVVCGIGAVLKHFNPPAEQGDKATVAYTMAVLTKKLLSLKVVREMVISKIKENWTSWESSLLDGEIYDSVLLLKNLAVAERERAFSADFIYEKLMDNSHRLKPIYSEMLSMYRNGRDSEAFDFFAEKTGSRYGKNFSMVLARLEKINPAELVEQMEVFQEMMMQQRMTDNLKRVQNSSLITTAAAAAVFFIMIIDFAVVVLFMNTLEMMGNVF